jgi:hypothetical protein
MRRCTECIPRSDPFIIVLVVRVSRFSFSLKLWNVIPRYVIECAIFFLLVERRKTSCWAGGECRSVRCVGGML